MRHGDRVRLPIAFFLLLSLPALAQTPPVKLKVGDTAPDFALPNGDGKLVTLADYTSQGPVILVFYRGYW